MNSFMADTKFQGLSTFEYEGCSYVYIEGVGDYFSKNERGDLDVDLYYEVESEKFFGDVVEGDIWRDLTDEEVDVYVEELGLLDVMSKVRINMSKGDFVSSVSRGLAKRETLGRRLEKAAIFSERADKRAKKDMAPKTHGENSLL